MNKNTTGSFSRQSYWAQQSSWEFNPQSKINSYPLQSTALAISFQPSSQPRIAMYVFA